ncbi:hypothetical protein QBC37DRAFT_264704, partial [Rhypophila decipiens]
SVIFIHGLRGHPQSTWEYRVHPPSVLTASGDAQRPKKTKISSKVRRLLGRSKARPEQTCDGKEATICWPADLLPNMLPSCRIWTYGYNADVATFFGTSNTNNLLKHANDLKVKLERALKDDVSTQHLHSPSFFVPHSLGGLLVKRALSSMESDVDQQYHQLLARVSAIVFCGCPHRGADTASWGLLALKLASVALVGSNPELLSALEVNSAILDLVHEDFLKTHRRSLSKVRIHSFLESRPLSGIKGLDSQVIVDTFSSKLGLAEERFETIDADHREMVREPGRPASGSGRKMITSLPRYVDQILSDPKLTCDDEPSEPYQHIDKYDVFDYRSVLERVQRRFPESCSWILESEAFTKWTRADPSHSFWLRGDPGQGKSVIARYFVEEVIPQAVTNCTIARDNRRACKPIVAYFFCSYQSPETKSLRSLLCSLIHQLLTQLPRSSDIGQIMRQRHELLTQSPNEGMRHLWAIFEELISTSSLRAGIPVYLVLDAMDELDQSDRIWLLKRLCPLMRDLTTRSLKNKTTRSDFTKLFITSRDEPDIVCELKEFDPWSLNLNTENGNADDLNKFITATVGEYGELNGFEKGLTKKITAALQIKAKGMFLWASLAWSYFIGGVGIWRENTIREQLEVLQLLPPGMVPLYQRILDGIDPRYRADLLHALQLIVAAVRPLTVDEIAIALALRGRPRRLCDLDAPSSAGIQSFFQRACPYLLKTDESGLVSLIHLSCRDYLVQIREIDHQPNKFYIDEPAANLAMGLDCLSYLGMDGFTTYNFISGRTLFERHSFLRYAHEYWDVHLRDRNDQVEDIWLYVSRL